MATKKKMLQAAAGNAGGEALNVEDVFSTYLYEGTNANQSITNGIDLAGEGGMVWVKARTADNNYIFDTERGREVLVTNATYASNVLEDSTKDLLTFDSNGYSIGPAWETNFNSSGIPNASWTFRKAPKFFDVVTYTGTGSVQNISHNLGSVPGCIIVKCTNTAKNWGVYHSGIGNTKYLQLNTTGEANISSSFWNNTDPTSTQFTLGTQSNINGSGNTYVAYLFAHNDGDGGFGADGDADIIKCGSYTGGSGNTEIDLGFEPQWLMIKRTDSAEDWLMLDVMRGLIVSGDDVVSNGQKDIKANTNAAEATPSYAGVSPQPNGFKVRSGLDALYSTNGGTYIYIAIRRGPMAVPEDATEVFETKTYSGTGAAQVLTTSLNAPDMAIAQNRSTSNWIPPNAMDRLRGDEMLQLSNTSAAVASAAYGISVVSDNQNTVDAGNFASSSGQTYVGQIWKRAPGFFDVVAYTGDGSSGSYAHNLGVVPELKIIKNRSGQFWVVGGSVVTGGTRDDYIVLNTSDSIVSSGNYWGSVDSDTTFSVRPANGASNLSGANYIAYLFASLPGISKVGSYTGDGTTDGSKVIDCGFTSGARFILIKRTDGGGSWYVWDTARGIVAGNDPRLKLESTDEEASFDNVDPHSSGFSVVGSGINNINGANYIFYAIA